MSISLEMVTINCFEKSAKQFNVFMCNLISINPAVLWKHLMFFVREH